MLAKLAYPVCAVLILLVTAVINLKGLRELLNISDGTFLYIFALLLLGLSFLLLFLLFSTDIREKVVSLWIAKASLVIIVGYVFWGTFMLISFLRSTDL